MWRARVRTVLGWAANLVLFVVNAVRWVADLVAEPTARLLLRNRAAHWRWLGAIGLLGAALAATLLAPQPFWIIAAVLGLFVLIAVFREWQRGEDYRERVLDRQTDDDPDLLPDLSALNAVASTFVLTLFAAVFFRLDGWVGGFVGARAPADFLLLSFDNLIDVITFDVGGAVMVGTTAVATDQPWAATAVALQKGLLAAMFIGAATSLIRSRQAVEDSIRILDTYPDISLRLGARGIEHLKKRLESRPPAAIDANTLGRLKAGAAYRLIADTVETGQPPASTTATWIATRLRDDALLEVAARRLNGYARFFSIYRRDYLERSEYEKAVSQEHARPLRFLPGKWVGQYQVDPTSADELYEADDIRDVCQLLDYFTAVHEPTPWVDEAVSVELALLLKANSPAIRTAAARYAAKYANFAAQAAPVALSLSEVLDEENAPRPALAMLQALQPFASRQPYVINAATRLLNATDTELARAAAAVLLAANDPSAVGATTIDTMFRDRDPYVYKCAAYLIYGSRDVAVEAGVAPHLTHEDEFVRSAVRSYVEDSRSPLGVETIARLLLGPDPNGEAGRLAITLQRASVGLKVPAPTLADLDAVIRQHERPLAVEQVIYAAQSMPAPKLIPAIEARIDIELASAEPGVHLLFAAATVLAEISRAGSAPAVRRIEAWARSVFDDHLARCADQAAAQLDAKP